MSLYENSDWLTSSKALLVILFILYTQAIQSISCLFLWNNHAISKQIISYYSIDLKLPIVIFINLRLFITILHLLGQRLCALKQTALGNHYFMCLCSTLKLKLNLLTIFLFQLILFQLLCLMLNYLFQYFILCFTIFLGLSLL